jgi:hypothetical protein
MAVGDSAPRSRSRRVWVRIPPKGEDFFEGRNLRRAMDVCVCLSGATLFRHHREVSRVRIPGRMGLPWMLCGCIRVVSSRKRRRERVGVGSRGKYPGALPHHRKNEKNKPTVKVPDRPSGERGKT